MSLNDEQQIRQAIDTWLQASREGDLATVMNLMTEDVVFLTPGNPPMSRADFENRSKAMTGNISIDGRPEIKEITILGETALCWNYLEMTITPLDGSSLPVKRAGNILSVFRKGADGQWRIWRDANMLAASS
ncbi:MAG TPA: SgcJ/EcaC family oxidoreductase [Edaphobacter sp.]|jgi:uncharacterized protein (TIGR02246 family)